ncbi:MAG: hypothetical protein KKA05_06550, partial [Alphaproteobacteria bacterium]|nr:hypothetical protein [Alphaproteobacteria bacterium]
NAGILSIARDRDTEVRATEKGQGLGKIFLSNMLTLAEELHLKRVDMRAGRENGAWYWSYRGAQLDTDVNSVVYERFERAVRQNMEKLPEALQQQAEAILATPGPDANVRLARLGREEGADLLNGTNPMVVFHVQDKTQMQNVRAALGNMDAAYERVRQRDIITPAAPKV